MIRFELLKGFFFIGARSFGGGYGALKLIEDSVVAAHGWLTYEQLADLITLAEITPGPIALNAASFTGYTVSGIPGAVAATVGCVLPSCALVSLLAFLYSRYREQPLMSSVLSSVRPAVCALIFSAFLTVALLALFGVSDFRELLPLKPNAAAILIFSGAVLLSKFTRIPPFLLILASGMCGVILL